MDFLKKKMKELLDDDDKPKKEEKKTDTSEPSHTDSHSAPGGPSHSERSVGDQYGGQSGGYPPQQQSYPQQQQSYPPQDQGHYQQQQQHQQSYSSQGPGYYQQQPQQHQQQQSYGQGAVPTGPPAPYGAPPPMPPGWIQQWDQNSQRWYYVEQTSGRTQWDPPSNLPPGPYAPPPPGAPYQPQAGHSERALFGNTQGHNGHDYNQATPGGYGGNPAYPDHSVDKGKDKDKKDKDKGHSTAMLAAAGIGGIAAGAWIGHELTEDDNTPNLTQQPTATPVYAPAPTDPIYAAPTTDPYDDAAFAAPPPVPTHDSDGSSISSSDRESMEDKREELIEAQEEYQEEIEENYGSD